MSKSNGDINKQSLALASLADLKYRSGDYLGSQMQARQAQKLAKLAANVHNEARASRTEAVCCISIGNFRDCISLLDRARELLRLCGMFGGYEDNLIMNIKAEVHLLKSEYTEALSIQRQIVKDTSEKKDSFNYAWAWLNIAEIDVIIGVDKESVLQDLEKGMKMVKSSQYAPGLSYCNRILAELDLRIGNKFAAKTQFQQCLRTMWGMNEGDVSKSLERLADISCWSESDIDYTSNWTVVYLVYAQSLHMKFELHKALLFLGDIFLHNDDRYTAHNLFTVALEGLTYMDVHRSKADCMLRLGDLARRQGDMAQAEALWKEARPLFEHSLQARDVEKIDNRLAAIAPDVNQSNI